MSLDQSTAQPPDPPGREIVSCGLRFPLDRSILAPRIRQSLRADGYEARERRAVLKLIRKGDRVLEAGAGIGFMSTLIAARTEAERVIGFEANPRLVPYVERVHRINNATQASVKNGILGAEAGQAHFFVRSNPLGSSLDPEPDGIVAKVQVPVHDVHAVMAAERPTILVCDIEGAEVDLIPAMDLTGLRGAIVELHPQWIGRDGVARVFAAMHDAGLVMFPRWSEGKVVCFRRDW